MSPKQPSISLKVDGVDDVNKKLGRLEGAAGLLGGTALYQEAEKIMTASKRLAPVGVHGTLRGSGDVLPPRKIPGRRGMEVLLGYGGAAEEYAVYVHEGTGPAVGRPRYFPPPEALEPWAKKKLGDPDLAYVVARKIYFKGTEPKKFLEVPFRAALPGLPDRIAEFIRRNWR